MPFANVGIANGITPTGGVVSTVPVINIDIQARGKRISSQQAHPTGTATGTRPSRESQTIEAFNMSYNPDWEKKNRTKRSARKRELRALKKQAQASATLAKPVFQLSIDSPLARPPSAGSNGARIAPRATEHDSGSQKNGSARQKESREPWQSPEMKELAQLGLAGSQILNSDASSQSLLIRVQGHANFTLKTLDDRISIYCSSCRLSGLISRGYLKQWIKEHLHP